MIECALTKLILISSLAMSLQFPRKLVRKYIGCKSVTNMFTLMSYNIVNYKYLKHIYN